MLNKLLHLQLFANVVKRRKDEGSSLDISIMESNIGSGGERVNEMVDFLNHSHFFFFLYSGLSFVSLYLQEYFPILTLCAGIFNPIQKPPIAISSWRKCKQRSLKAASHPK